MFSGTWTSVTEQLPEEDGVRVLVTTNDGVVTIAKYYADDEGDYWEDVDAEAEDSLFVLDPVIAWSELPEPFID